MSDQYQPLIITRTFHAPIDLVWELWTQAEHLSKWWCPDGFSVAACEADVTTGGSIRLDMQGPDGTIFPMTGTYQTVEKPTRIVFTATPLDNDNKPLFETQTTVSFHASGDDTILELEINVLNATEAAAPYLGGMEMGWQQSLNKQDQLLRKQ